MAGKGPPQIEQGLLPDLAVDPFEATSRKGVVSFPEVAPLVFAVVYTWKGSYPDPHVKVNKYYKIMALQMEFSVIFIEIIKFFSRIDARLSEMAGGMLNMG